MPSTPVINVSPCAPNSFLSAEPDALRPSSRHGHSASTTPSVRSSKSRITLVDDDPTIASQENLKGGGSTTFATTHTRHFSWFDHLCAVFCIPRQGTMIPIASGKPPESEHDEINFDESPWVLPVLVYSARRDTDKIEVPKQAKCTIDTGNMQGNIVSREFVENVLGFSAESFVELTNAEREGGSGVTGHKLIPEGAIYLTWYHKKSTRVFRDMRFLISPNPNYDLIIGARSIQKNNLLDVPNFMNGRSKGITTVPKNGSENEKKATLRENQARLEAKKREIEKSLEKAQFKNDVELVKELESILAKCDEKLKLATAKYELCKAKLDGNTPLAEEHQKTLDQLELRRSVSLSSDPGSTAMPQNGTSHTVSKRKLFSRKHDTGPRQ